MKLGGVSLGETNCWEEERVVFLLVIKDTARKAQAKSTSAALSKGKNTVAQSEKPSEGGGRKKLFQSWGGGGSGSGGQGDGKTWAKNR